VSLVGSRLRLKHCDLSLVDGRLGSKHYDMSLFGSRLRAIYQARVQNISLNWYLQPFEFSTNNWVIVKQAKYQKAI